MSSRISEGSVTLLNSRHKQNSTYSIRKRFILFAGLLPTIIIVLISLWLYAETKHEIEEIYDARLAQSSRIIAMNSHSLANSSSADRALIYQNWDKLLTLSNSENDSDDNETSPFGHTYEQKLLFQIIAPHVSVLFSTPNAPKNAINPTPAAGFDTRKIADKNWRTFTLKITDINAGSRAGSRTVPTDGPLWIIVAENMSVRDELIEEIALSTITPLLLLIPIMVILLIILINKILSPLAELKASVARRNVGNLTRISDNSDVEELQPLITQINYLLNELEQAWQREQRFTNEAAHEIRTPLAVLKLNAENAINANNIDEIRADLNLMLKGFYRCERVVNQLLALTRVDSQQQIELSAVAIVPLLQEVITEVVPLALQNNQTIALNHDITPTVLGHELLLYRVFHNLIDNAIRYAGNQSDISVSITLHETEVEITVSDNGIGLTNEVNTHIFERFYRGNSSNGDGSGLGMSIAARIAALHGTVINVNHPLKGASFSIRLKTISRY